MKLHPHAPHKRYARGMTLVEVLVAAIVIAVGLLGIASLQINALQGATDAQYRAKAADAIASLADRIRANQAAVEFYNDAIPADSCALAPEDTLATIQRCAMSPDGPVGASSPCSQQEMALYDLWEVNCSLQSNVPGAVLSITCPAPDCNNLTPITVNISWQVQIRNPESTSSPTFETNDVVATIFPGEPR